MDDLEGNISQPPQGRGDMSFNGQYTDISNKSSGLNGIGDLLVTPINYEYGVGTGVNLVGGQNGISASNIPVTDDHRWYIGAYFQDDWKVNPKSDAESRLALGSVHALRRNPGLPVQLRSCGRQWRHRNLLHPQPGLPDAASSDL